MDTINKIVAFLSQSDFSVVLKIILLLAMGFFAYYLKVAARELQIKRSRKKEQEAKIQAEIKQTEENKKIEEQVKKDGNAADIFLEDK